MPVCKKCHRFKKKSVLARHQKTCIPSPDEVRNYLASKGGSLENRKITKAERRRRKKMKKKGGEKK